MKIPSISSTFFKSEVYFKNSQDVKRDYEKPEFTKSIVRPSERDVFEKMVENNNPQNTHALFHYVGKIFEDAGELNIAKDFYNKNLIDDICTENNVLQELDKIDLNRVNHKIEQISLNQPGDDL